MPFSLSNSRWPSPQPQSQLEVQPPQEPQLLAPQVEVVQVLHVLVVQVLLAQVPQPLSQLLDLCLQRSRKPWNGCECSQPHPESQVLQVLQVVQV